MSIQAIFTESNLKANAEKKQLDALQKDSLQLFMNETSSDKQELDQVTLKMTQNQKHIEAIITRITDQEVKIQKQIQGWQVIIDKFAVSLKSLGDVGLHASTIINDLKDISEKI